MSPRHSSTFFFSLKDKIHPHWFLWSEKVFCRRKAFCSMGIYAFVQNVCINIIDRPKKDCTQASQNSSVTQSSMFSSRRTGICFKLGERWIKRTSWAHPIHSVWYCWLKLKTAGAYSDLKSCVSSISGLLHKAQVALFLTFLHECQDQFYLEGLVLHLLCISKGTFCSQKPMEEGIHSH